MDAVDLLIHGASQLVTCADDGTGPRRGAAMSEPGLIADGAVAVHDGRIIAVGQSTDLCARFHGNTTIDAAGKVVTPGFVDPHTHLVFAGDRVDEWERKLRGVPYLEILREGGGILATVRATRLASHEALVAASEARLGDMLRAGTTTAEVKTGYGLDLATEIRMLEVIESLQSRHPIDLVPTFLGAHAVPPEFSGEPDAYIHHLIADVLPAACDWYENSGFRAGGVPFSVDVFCEQKAFDVAQSRRILQAGQRAGLQVRAHVDQFTSLGGVAMALALGAASIDHLDVTNDADIAALARTETVAVLLPAVTFHLGSTEYAPARRLIDAGAAVALATDLNPGSAPCTSLLLVMAIATRYMHLTPSEALLAVTINAAHALKLADRVGSLEPGKQADILIHNVTDFRQLTYRLGGNPVLTVIKRGTVIRL
jgi:imidazolonepropionase